MCAQTNACLLNIKFSPFPFAAHCQLVPRCGVKVLRRMRLPPEGIRPFLDEFWLIDHLVALWTACEVGARGAAFDMDDGGLRLVVDAVACLANLEAVIRFLVIAGREQDV